ncbi:glycosyltransferase family 2 protein [Luteolibacter sp. SL250]|uniref:glycosyltransferase family 2 protein n=1 Tax=Luteolibacter sp. SL250 TaxID=2995170 RepID=UPI00226EE08B|nr:glycosyltransferase family 2 protein [Luteolibacter sp. SL250]WAC19636.1 glycosyltransferase family 2 protein [Luteolibacter sp. SL250]
MLEVLFWFSLLLVAYANVGYPVLLWIACRLRAPKVPAEAYDQEWPVVSVVMIAHNEGKRITGKLENLLQCDYPGELEVVVVCDGCDDATAELSRSSAGDRGRTIESVRCGKAEGLNQGVAAARGTILVFADVRQEFDPSAILRLVMPFSDAAIVGVSGSLEIKATAEGPGKGIDLYWKLEKFIRLAESEIDSCIGCTGAIYALRADCYRVLPADTLLDDVVVPMLALQGGGRVLFEPEARAYDPQELTTGNERRRKTRTLAGNFQMLFRYPGWLVPFRSRLWLQLLSHKYLRLAVPFLLMACFATNALLVPSGGIYPVLFALQLAAYAFAIMGMAPALRKLRIFSIPGGFLYLQYLCILGLLRYIRMRTVRKPTGW